MASFRPLVLSSALLLACALLPPPAAAGACSGSWTTGATCTFPCDGPTLTVWGDAHSPPAPPAYLTVTAECGAMGPSGFTVVASVSCSASGFGPVSCFNATTNPLPVPGLVGRCSVTGHHFGNYACTAT